MIRAASSRVASAASAATAQAKPFSTSSTQRDLAGLYNRFTNWRKPKAPTQLHDPTKEDKVQESLPEDSVPRKLRVLGKPKNSQSDWARVKKVAEFSAWPLQQHRSDLTSEQINQAVDASFAGVDVADIAARFAALKAVSQALNLAVPDHVLSSMSCADDVKQYLLSVARPYDERMPDAIYLDPQEFEGTNVTIVDPVAERRERAKRYSELLRSAKAAQEKKTEELLQ